MLIENKTFEEAVDSLPQDDPLYGVDYFRAMIKKAIENIDSCYLEDRVCEFSSEEMETLIKYGFKIGNLITKNPHWTTIHHPEGLEWSDILEITDRNYDNNYSYWTFWKMEPNFSLGEYNFICIQQDQRYRNYVTDPIDSNNKQPCKYFIGLIKAEELEELGEYLKDDLIIFSL